MYDDNRWQTHENMDGPGMKIRSEKGSFGRRNRWIIISSVAILVALFFSITTIYLLVNRPKVSAVPAAAPTATAVATTAAAPTVQPTSTPASSIASTVVASPATTTTPLTTTTKDHLFICITNCDNTKLAVILNSLTINTTGQTMKWDFTITNNGDLCNYGSGNLTLEDLAANKLQADGGTFIGSTSINSGQALPMEATFSSIPKQGTQYTVTLQASCNYVTAGYQVELFQY